MDGNKRLKLETTKSSSDARASSRSHDAPPASISWEHFSQSSRGSSSNAARLLEQLSSNNMNQEQKIFVEVNNHIGKAKKAMDTFHEEICKKIGGFKLEVIQFPGGNIRKLSAISEKKIDTMIDAHVNEMRSIRKKFEEVGKEISDYEMLENINGELRFLQYDNDDIINTIKNDAIGAIDSIYLINKLKPIQQRMDKGEYTKENRDQKLAALKISQDEINRVITAPSSGTMSCKQQNELEALWGYIHKENWGNKN